MTALTIKNIPDKLYQLLKQQAAQHRRSINSEVIVCLESILLGENKRHTADVLIKKAQKLRQKTKSFYLNEKILRILKSEGRA